MNERAAFRILFVDDQARHRRIYAQAIEDALPVHVTFADNGPAALAIVDGAEPPELVILDLDLPGMSGEKVLEKIRLNQKSRLVPVLILTGSGSLEKQLELLDKGADDFLEKGMPPEILIARLRAQMRHKLATSRLERLALDRDLFAAGVLSDIGSIRGAITSICRAVKELIAESPEKNRERILAHLTRLSTVASKLGGYAADVIQSVRDTSRAAKAGREDWGQTLDWVLEVLTVGDAGPEKHLVFDYSAPLKPVLADANYLRLALLNVAQNAQRRRPEGARVVIRITQDERLNRDDPMQRVFVTTSFTDDGPPATAAEVESAFDVNSAGEGHGLGLALVAKVMGKMAGGAFAEVSPQGGLSLCLDLPAAD